MKKIISMISMAILLTTTAIAQNVKSDAYNSPSDIPLPLRNAIRSYGAMYMEQYISQELGIIRQNGRDKISIDKQDIDAIKKKEETEQRRRQIQQMMAYDLNFDGKVTRDEVITAISAATQAGLNNENIDGLKQDAEKRADRIMKADTNGDGILTLQEISVLPDNENAARYSRTNGLEPLLALDPNGDGKLTVSELEVLAQKAFRTVDTDNNGILSAEELKPLQKINIVEAQRENEMQTITKATSECKLPTPAADEKIVFIGVYGGKTVSTVSVAGQVAETNVIPLEIDKTAGKLYIVANSFKPVIWQIKGATNSISHLVLAGPSIPEGTSNNDMGDDKINVGATGITADKVTFRHARKCGMWDGYKSEPDQQERLKSTLQNMLGRSLDIFGANHSIMSVNIADNHINLVQAAPENTQQTPPKGFDANAWKIHLRGMPGGIIDLKNEKIVSDAPAVAYQVLPKWAGLAKLVYEGAITPIASDKAFVILNRPNGSISIHGAENINLDGISPSNLELAHDASGFKIVKDIPYYPAGLNGGFSTHFVIAKGVKPPKGDRGHSSVVCEGTGMEPGKDNTCP